MSKQFKQYTTGEMLDLMPHLLNGSAFTCVSGPKSMEGVGAGTVVVKDKGIPMQKLPDGTLHRILVDHVFLSCKWEQEPYEIDQAAFFEHFERGDVIEIRTEGHKHIRISNRQPHVTLTPEQFMRGRFYIAREAANV